MESNRSAWRYVVGLVAIVAVGALVYWKFFQPEVTGIGSEYTDDGELGTDAHRRYYEELKNKDPKI